MEDSLSNNLMSVLPDTQMRKKRPSSKTAVKIVKNSVKGIKRNITGEQGFRNYLKYTDPLLQESDETTDQSQLADDMEKIMNVVRPDGDFNKSVDKLLRNEPVSDADALSEISASPLAPRGRPEDLKIYNTPTGINKSLNASDLFTTPKSGRTKEQETRKAFSASVKKHVEGKEEKKAGVAVSVLQASIRGKIARDDDKILKTATKATNVIGVAYKAKKARDELKLLEQQQQQQKAINVISSAIKTKKAKEEMLKPLKEKKATLNKLNKTLDPDFYKRGKNKNKPDNKVSKK